MDVPQEDGAELRVIPCYDITKAIICWMQAISTYQNI